jgi:putative oxidoreductase
MKDKGETVTQICAFLLIVLFVYTAISKLIAFQNFQEQMLKQAVPVWMAKILIWALPAIELVVAVLLSISNLRLIGFMISFVLMMLFTTYIGLAMLNVFSRVPCSCGGVLKIMGWKVHFFFNLFFLLLSFTGILLMNRERRIAG